MRTFLPLLLVVLSFPASGDEIDRLIGEWQSPDGSSKQSFESAFDGEWVRAE